MEQAIELAVENVLSGGGPFGALVVKNNEIVATGVNLVTRNNDPTAHAEVVAIRAACQILGNFQLTGCEIYTSSEPCPMCLGAIYWARPDAYYFACNRGIAAEAGFDDALIYSEMGLAPGQRSTPGYCVLPEAGLRVFEEWSRNPHKIPY